MTNRLLRVARNIAVAITVTMTVAVVGPVAPSFAIEEYVYDPQRDVPPADTVPGPKYTMELNSECAKSAQLRGSQFDSPPINTVFETSRLHDMGYTGKGQTVAVIDSGVSRNSRLPLLIGGGDFIEGKDGLSDCDHHGTPVAGLIAAKPAPLDKDGKRRDGFVGVAPDAAILSIRQFSNAFKPKVSGYNADVQAQDSVESMAKAIVHAANRGATVMNISVTVCASPSARLQLSQLAGALYYAAVVKDVVIVTAAGNVGNSSPCQQNPGPSPDDPNDVRGWGTVKSISVPSMFDKFVLSVGGTTLTGDPYVRTQGGPWVGVGAPAISVVSLDPSNPDGNLINAQIDPKSGAAEAIGGTSFASAPTAGLAALIRQKNPKLTSHQVIEVIKRTAHSNGQQVTNLIGAGNIDPVAALTTSIDTTIPRVAEGVPAQWAVEDGPAAPEDTLGRTIALIALGGAGLVLFLAVLIRISTGRKESK